MIEHAVLALVLDKEERRGYDETVWLLVPEMGVIQARVVAGKKITSKLSPHLEPGMITRVRLVEKNGLVVADALSLRGAKINWPRLMTLKFLAGEEPMEKELWEMIVRGEMGVNDLLSYFGFDVTYATCYFSGVVKPDWFWLRENLFIADNQLAALKLPSDEVVYIG